MASKAFLISSHLILFPLRFLLHFPLMTVQQKKSVFWVCSNMLFYILRQRGKDFCQRLGVGTGHNTFLHRRSDETPSRQQGTSRTSGALATRLIHVAANRLRANVFAAATSHCHFSFVRALLSQLTLAHCFRHLERPTSLLEGSRRKSNN